MDITLERIDYNINLLMESVEIDCKISDMIDESFDIKGKFQEIIKQFITWCKQIAKKIKEVFSKSKDKVIDKKAKEVAKTIKQSSDKEETPEDTNTKEYSDQEFSSYKGRVNKDQADKIDDFNQYMRDSIIKINQKYDIGEVLYSKNTNRNDMSHIEANIYILNSDKIKDKINRLNDDLKQNIGSTVNKDYSRYKTPYSMYTDSRKQLSFDVGVNEMKRWNFALYTDSPERYIDDIIALKQDIDQSIQILANTVEIFEKEIQSLNDRMNKDIVDKDEIKSVLDTAKETKSFISSQLSYNLEVKKALIDFQVRFIKTFTV